MKTNTIDEELLTAIKNKDIITIRGILISYLDFDPGDFRGYFKEWLDYTTNECIKYNIHNLFVSDDENLFYEENQWSKKLYNELKAELQFKFSKNRIQLILKMGQHLNKNPLQDNHLMHKTKTSFNYKKLIFITTIIAFIISIILIIFLKS